jgi:hypothetical protein
MGTGRRGRFAGAVLPAVVALAACSAEPAPGPAGTDAVRSFVAAPPEKAARAVILGELVLTEGRCLAVQAADRQHVVLWPAGVTSTADGVEVPGLGRFGPGDQLRAGGGYFPRSDTGPRAVVPADCWADAASGGLAVIGSVVSIARD